jgi:hypothetical protein
MVPIAGQVYGAVLGIAQEVAIANFSCLKLRRKCHDWCAGTQVLVLVAPDAHDSHDFVKSFYSAGTLAGYFLTNRGAHVKQVVYKPNKTPPETPKATIQSFLRETCAVKRVIVYIGHGSKDGSIHLAGTPVAPAELSQWIEDSGGASRTGLVLAMCYGGSCSRLLDREMGFVFTGSLPHQQEFGQELPNWFFDDGKVLPLANSNAVCSGKIVQGHPAAVNGEVIMCKTCRGGGSSGGSSGGAGGRRGGAGGGGNGARGESADDEKHDNESYSEFYSRQGRGIAYREADETDMADMADRKRDNESYSEFYSRQGSTTARNTTYH